jgi:hypothetical protein
MFPGTLMLDVEQVATILDCAKGHLYNLCSKGRLPFKLAQGEGKRFRVSIIELADYMDKTMLTDQPKPVGSVTVPVEVKRKPGRPRGSTKALVMGFQQELMHILGLSSQAQVDELGKTEPRTALFVDTHGRVSCAPLWPLAQVPDVPPPPERVVWMTWTEGLAAVWEDEAMRLKTLARMGQFVPDLAFSVATVRNNRLQQL